MLLCPNKDSIAVSLAIAAYPTKFAPVLGAIVEDVVNGQELWLSLSTACAFVSAVGHDRFVPNLLPVLSSPPTLRRYPFRVGLALLGVLVPGFRSQGLVILSPVLCLICLVAIDANRARLTRLLFLLSAFPARYDH
jgi:hypothetical protein